MSIVIKMIIFFIAVANIVKLFIFVNYEKKILQLICYPPAFNIDWQE